MALANDPLAEIHALVVDSIRSNTEFTTCPVCLGGVDPGSFHKEPYIAALPGSAAETGMVRRILHTQLPDGSWKTSCILDYE